ncbi:hypothetical protein [Bordetella phage vB_BbrM_PHB04]|uniref:Uncharacterized protein n=1 Tax=Bordetella phage vB_BbrM_PHB04 TaxID=2029657 RepID=A0A291L9Y5_9CAUD|nr:hypothetical protein HOS14_gp077 [Bordetella phage vB_BbrM_PHB04]ATI15695.1 hypothetical protein [Bordetella phage vB_BbrM_PHB04]
MNQRQRHTIEQIAARLKKPHAGASVGGPLDSEEVNKAIELLQSKGFEVTSRLYLNTWVIPPLDLMLSDAAHDQKLALDLSRP